MLAFGIMRKSSSMKSRLGQGCMRKSYSMKLGLEQPLLQKTWTCDLHVSRSNKTNLGLQGVIQEEQTQCRQKRALNKIRRFLFRRVTNYYMSRIIFVLFGLICFNMQVKSSSFLIPAMSALTWRRCFNACIRHNEEKVHHDVKARAGLREEKLLHEVKTWAVCSYLEEMLQCLRSALWGKVTPWSGGLSRVAWGKVTPCS